MIKNKNFLIIRMNKIGDMVCTIPLIKTIKKNFEDVNIIVLAEEEAGKFIKEIKLVDDVIIYRRKQNKILHNRYFEIFRLITKYKRKNKKNFDVAVAVKGGFSSFLALISYISGAKIRIGYVSNKFHPCNFLYTYPIKPLDFSKYHQIEACLNLLSPFNLKEFVKDLYFEVPNEYKLNALKFMNTNKLNYKERLIVFNISNNRVKSKWRSDNFIYLGKSLINYNYKIIVTSTKVDEEEAKMICKKLGNRAFYYKSKNILDFAAITSQANFLIAGDGGAIHIGAAMKTKVIALFGETNEIIYGPYGDSHIIIKSSTGDVNSITVEDVIKNFFSHYER